jgi:putative endonuclease
MKDIPYFVYLLKCKDGSIYTGIAVDVQERFARHKAGRGGHYTRARGAVKILYSEKQPNRSVALRREAEIKKWRRER